MKKILKGGLVVTIAVSIMQVSPYLAFAEDKALGTGCSLQQLKVILKEMKCNLKRCLGNGTSCHCYNCTGDYECEYPYTFSDSSMLNGPCCVLMPDGTQTSFTAECSKRY